MNFFVCFVFFDGILLYGVRGQRVVTFREKEVIAIGRKDKEGFWDVGNALFPGQDHFVKADGAVSLLFCIILYMCFTSTNKVY